jgi:hypothetical protein
MKTILAVAIGILAGAIAVVFYMHNLRPGTSVNAAGSPASASSPTGNPPPVASATGIAVSAPAPEPAAAGSFGAMKTAEIVDPMFNMVAYTISIPANWNFEGTILHGPGCNSDYAAPVFRANSADMLFGIQMTPTSIFYWEDDPHAVPKGADCKDLQPISAASYGALVSIRMRPDSEVDSVEASPYEGPFLENLEKMNANLAAAARNMGNPNPSRYKGEMKRIHIRYNLSGHPEEEWMNVGMSLGDMPVSINTAPIGQMIRLAMRHEYISIANVSGARTPQGQMQNYDAALQTMVKSFNPNPEYIAKWTAYIQDKTQHQIAQSWQTFNSMIQRSNDQMAQMRANAQQAIKDMQAQGDARRDAFNAQMDRRSRQSQDFCDYVLNQQLYINPTTGQTTTQSNQYNHTYSNGGGPGGTILQTNSPTNPNGLTPGNWTELQPIKH